MNFLLAGIHCEMALLLILPPPDQAAAEIIFVQFILRLLLPIVTPNRFVFGNLVRGLLQQFPVFSQLFLQKAEFAGQFVNFILPAQESLFLLRRSAAGYGSPGIDQFTVQRDDPQALAAVA